MRIRSLLFVAVVTSAGTFAAAQDAKYRAPRNELGQPDLQGVWSFTSDVPLERPAKFADRKFFTREEFAAERDARRKGLASIATLAPIEAVGVDWIDLETDVDDLRTSLITYPENGRLPALVEGVRRVPGLADFIGALSGDGGRLSPALLAAFSAGKRDGHEDLNAAERCLGGASAPYEPGFSSSYVQIIQSRDHAALMTEDFHAARIVPLDQRPQIGAKLRSWDGYARGHWEGDTLVVETRNFNSRTPSFAGAGTAQDKVITERFTRTSSKVMQYEATIVDPKTFQDKIVISRLMGKTDARLFEVACHEGNYSLPMTLRGARKDEAEGPKVRLQQITLLDREGKTVRTVGEPGTYAQAALSPDGARVAVIRTDPETQNRNVWVYDVAAGKGTSITADAAANSTPVWSPDGRQIAYVTSSEGDNREVAVYRAAADGSGREELIYKHTTGALLMLTDWSADDVLSVWAEKVLYALPLKGDRKPVALSDGTYNVRGGRFSPDGRLIAYNSDESGRFQVYVRPFTLAAGSVSSPQTKPFPVSDGQAIGAISWRQDGKAISFLASPQQAMMAADLTVSPSFEAAKPRLLFRMPAGYPAPAQLSNVATADGQRFVYLAQITVPLSTIVGARPPR